MGKKLFRAILACLLTVAVTCGTVVSGLSCEEIYGAENPGGESEGDTLEDHGEILPENPPVSPETSRKTRYINGIISDADMSLDEEGNPIIGAMEGEPFDGSRLPEYFTATVGWKEGETSDSPDFHDWNVVWDTEELDGRPVQAGDRFTVKGRWGEPVDALLENGTEALAVTETTTEAYADVYEPVCTVVACSKTGLVLPERIRFHSKSQPDNVWVYDRPSELLYIQTEQRYLTDRVVHKIHLREVGGEEWTTIGETWYGWSLPGSVAVVDGDDLLKGSRLQIKNFFDEEIMEDGKQYEVYVETKIETDDDEIVVVDSNPIVIDFLPVEDDSDSPGTDPGDKDDGNSGGNRGGGKRNPQEDTWRELSAKQVSTLVRQGGGDAVIELSGVKIIVDRGTLETWASGNSFVKIQCERKDETTVAFQVERDGKAADVNPKAYCLRIPLKLGEGALAGISETTAKQELVTECDGTLIGSAFYDSSTGEMVIYTGRGGKFTIARRNPVKFTDTNGHWVAAVADFASARGIVSGYGDGTLRPDQPVTCAEFQTMLTKAMGTGTGKYIYRGDRNTLRRIDAAKMICDICGNWMAGGNQLTGGNAVNFVDLAGLAPEEREYAARVGRAGIMNGHKGGRFSPGETMSRAEALAAIVNLIHN